jgi:hypothetical protein
MLLLRISYTVAEDVKVLRGLGGKSAFNGGAKEELKLAVSDEAWAQGAELELERYNVIRLAGIRVAGSKSSSQHPPRVTR